MANWYMLTLVGEDRHGIVAQVTRALFDGGCHLGEASMIRLGGNFTIMLMVRTELDPDQTEQLVRPVAEQLGLRAHIDRIHGHLHQHRIPNVHVTVFGADRAGIIAQITGILADAGLDILNLESDVGGSERQPIYIMQLEGLTSQPIESLQAAITRAGLKDIDVRITPIDTVMG